MALNFKIRYEEAFGYIHPKVYTQTKKGKLKDYRTPWILLEDTPDDAKRFAWVFYNFNIFTTLNYYQGDQVTKECFVDLAFDFDSPELDKSRLDAMKMSEFLLAKQIPYSPFFSGKKGFHIVIGYQAFCQEYQESNHLINKEMAKLMLQETGPLPSLDMAIYSSRRQFRFPNSLHSGSGLFKIPITHEELTSVVDQILKPAKKKRDSFSLSSPVSNGYLHHIYLQAKQNIDRLPKYDVPEVDLGVLGGNYPPCINECLKIGIKPGANANRNETTMLLASFFKGQGLDMRSAQDKLVTHALGVLKRFSASSDTEIKSSTKTCVSSVYRSHKYSFNCQLARGKFKLRCDDTCRLYRKYKDISCSRKLHYIEVEQPVPQPTYTIEGIREGICQQIDDYLADPQGRILLIKVPAGVGKTITTIQHLTFGKRRIFWVASRKDMFGNIPYDHQFKWKQILGRHDGVYDDEGKPLIEPNCEHAKLAHILGHKNHDINQRLCKGHCDLSITNCDYFRQFHDRQYHWFVQQPFFFYTQDNFVAPFDVVVIDEDILECFKKETRITLNDVRQNFELFKATKKDQELDKIYLHDLYVLLGKPPQAYKPVNKNLDPIIKLLYIIGMVAKSNIPFGTSETGKLILDKVRAIAKEKLGENIEDIISSITDPHVFDKEINFGLEDKSKIPLNFFSYLYEVLSYELFHKHSENNLSRLFFQKRNIQTKQGSVCLENFLLINKLEKHTDKPIIILDATGKKLVYEKLFGREVIEYAPQVKLENEIIQVYSSLNSKQALSIKNHFERNMEAVKKLVAEEPNTLIVCKEAFKDKVAAQIPRPAKVVHFYGLRGTNEYQDFKQVIILGTPQNREDEIKKFAGILYYNEDRPIDTSIEYKYTPYLAFTKNARAPAIRTRVFRDPLLQEINQIYREDEIIQGINRIRIVLDFTKQVVVLSNIPLPGLPITELIELRDITGDFLARKAIKQACRYFLNNFGFVQRLNFIDWNISSEYSPSPKAVAFFKEHSIWFPVSKRYSRRTINTHFRPIMEEMELQSFRLNFKGKNEHSFLEIWGGNEACLERSRLLLSNLRKDLTFY